MKTILFTFFIVTLSISAFSQNQNNIFKTYEDFKGGQPTDFVKFQLKKRTGGNVFMTGGITNYRLKKIVPETRNEEVTREIWGLIIDDSVYINSYPYSNIIGFNKLIEDGYYGYFVGEPASLKEKQVELGIIEPDEPQKVVCCQTSYVILPNGEIKWLTPELLGKLINDNQELTSEFESDKILQEDAYKMFGYLSRYNKMKK